MEFTRSLSKLNKDDTAIAGGKGASLGEMIQSGMIVPAGFVVLADAFEHFIEKTDVNVEIDAALDSVNIDDMQSIENASEKIHAIILNADIPEDIIAEINKSFKGLSAKFVAVRSSATAEDSAAAAWAGQLETFLNTTEETVVDNVRKCWASLFSPRAIFYRLSKNLKDTKISVAVVIQKMVNSEIAGVAFSVHPVTQDKNQLIIEAGFGLGESIVSGQITPDSYVVDKEDNHIIDKHIGSQEKGLYRKENGGNEWKEIPKAEGESQKLTDDEIATLSKRVIEIEKHYSFPVDIEWALWQDEFFILQSRPITTLTQ